MNSSSVLTIVPAACVLALVGHAGSRYQSAVVWPQHVVALIDPARITVDLRVPAYVGADPELCDALRDTLAYWYRRRMYTDVADRIVLPSASARAEQAAIADDVEMIFPEISCEHVVGPQAIVRVQCAHHMIALALIESLLPMGGSGSDPALRVPRMLNIGGPRGDHRSRIPVLPMLPAIGFGSKALLPSQGIFDLRSGIMALAATMVPRSDALRRLECVVQRSVTASAADLDVTDAVYALADGAVAWRNKELDMAPRSPMPWYSARTAGGMALPAAPAPLTVVLQCTWRSVFGVTQPSAPPPQPTPETKKRPLPASAPAPPPPAKRIRGQPTLQLVSLSRLLLSGPDTTLGQMETPAICSPDTLLAWASTVRDADAARIQWNALAPAVRAHVLQCAAAAVQRNVSADYSLGAARTLRHLLDTCLRDV
jgi:hypothetical protein